jgi:hypothetical protein
LSRKLRVVEATEGGILDFLEIRQGKEQATKFLGGICASAIAPDFMNNCTPVMSQSPGTNLHSVVQRPHLVAQRAEFLSLQRFVFFTKCKRRACSSREPMMQSNLSSARSQA